MLYAFAFVIAFLVPTITLVWCLISTDSAESKEETL